LPFLSRVCALAVPEVGVSGAGVTVMGSLAEGIAGRRDRVACRGAASRRLADLQLTAGQGPCLDAFAAGAKVLVGDLEVEASRWPGFAPEALALGVVAVFSFPLQVGAVRLGTLDLYRVTVGPLTAAELDAALLLAGMVSMAEGIGGRRCTGADLHPCGERQANGCAPASALTHAVGWVRGSIERLASVFLVLFHSMFGLRAVELLAAERLRAVGYDVFAPDRGLAVELAPRARALIVDHQEVVGHPGEHRCEVAREGSGEVASRHVATPRNPWPPRASTEVGSFEQWCHATNL
jgi:hypothetical protein